MFIFPTSSFLPAPETDKPGGVEGGDVDNFDLGGAGMELDHAELGVGGEGYGDEMNPQDDADAGNQVRSLLFTLLCLFQSILCVYVCVFKVPQFRIFVVWGFDSLFCLHWKPFLPIFVAFFFCSRRISLFCVCTMLALVRLGAGRPVPAFVLPCINLELLIVCWPFALPLNLTSFL